MALIYVVEDDESIGTLIAATLKAAGHEARVLPNGHSLTEVISHALPELLLLDIMLPDKDGFSLLEEWKMDARTADIPVIVLSAKSEELDKVRGLELGAEDYVAKPFGVLELQARVKAALRRRIKPAGTILAGDLRIDENAKEVYRNGEPVRLTHKEMELLVYLANHIGQVISREQLLSDVWGYQYEGDTTRTVDYHIGSIRQKLSDNAENARYIETVRGYGYRLRRG